MDSKLILVNGRLIFALITAIGGALVTARVMPSDLYPTLRLYLTSMVVLGIGLDIFARIRLHSTEDEES